MYEPIMKSSYGALDPKVSLEPDFFTGFRPEHRKEITDAEARFYRSITEPYTVDDKLEKSYITVPARDGFHIPIKVYRRKEVKTEAPALMFIHGGGFITCTPETHDYVPSYITAKTGTVCFSIDYRLAPEYKFPVGIEDCADVLEWIFLNAEKLGIDKKRISVGGDSSGGTYTAVLTQLMKNSNKVRIWKQVLIYPATDFSGDIPKKSAEVYTMVGSGGDEKKHEPTFLQRYLNKNEDLRNPMISPLLAKDLSELPEALFIQAECDALCDDGLLYAKRLQDAGVKVACQLYTGMPHAFILRTYDESFSALDKICNFLSR